MANLYPQKFPMDLNINPFLKAEESAFEYLSKLSDKFHIFYDIKFQLPEGRNIRDYQIDFLIAHPDLGILVIEVKGGKVEYSADTGKWITIDRNKDSHDIDPYEQAKKNKYGLIEYLKKKSTNEAKQPIGFAIFFPSLKKIELPFEDIFLFYDDVDKLEKRLVTMFQYYNPQGIRLGETGIQALKKLFAFSFKLEIPLAVKINTITTKLLELTNSQKMLLQFIANKKKAIIQGAAGSGKTILALEKAKQMAELGIQTLFLCYNRPLCEYVRKAYGKIPNLEVYTFHELCDKYGREAGLIKGQVDTNSKEYFDLVLPNILDNSLDKIKHRYHAIIVDEGQDFHSKWWTTIAFLLDDYDSNLMYIFCDNFQKVNNSEKIEYPFQEPTFPLPKNMRNTNQIFDLAKKFYHGDLSINSSEISGVPIKKASCKDLDLIPKLSEILYDLISKELIALEDIAILYGNDLNISIDLLKSKNKNLNFTKSDSFSANSIVFDSIKRFKGLEKKVIILFGLTQLLDNEDYSTIYVGLTRATSHLILLEKSEVLDRF